MGLKTMTSTTVRATRKDDRHPIALDTGDAFFTEDGWLVAQGPMTVLASRDERWVVEKPMILEGDDAAG